MTILAAGIIGVVGAFSTAGLAGDLASGLEQAALLAERELELAVRREGDDLEPLAGGEGPYTWRIEFEAKSHRLAVAAIKVRWSARGQMRTFELERVFVRR